MSNQEKQIYRLELQLAELIRLVANLQERLKVIEQYAITKRTFKIERPPKSRMTG